MSALIVTIHALLQARAQVESDRHDLFVSTVNATTGNVDDASAAALLRGYDHTLATIDDAIERAKQQPDISLRDHFAAKAMQALITATRTTTFDAAPLAYEIADRMLKARVA